MAETAVSNVSGKEITVSSTSGFMVGSLVRFVNDTVGNTLTYRITNIVSTTITVDTSLTTDSSASNLFLVDYVLFSTNAIIGNEQHNQDTTLRTNVFLEFASRNTGDVEGQTPSSNRVMLLMDTFSIQVNKTSPTIDLYGSALLTGESRTITFDLAASRKAFSGNGIIMEQHITRQYEKDVNDDYIADADPASGGATVTRLMTAYEIAQWLQSSLDSSPRQKYQHLNRLGFLIPSRVGYNYNYHNSQTETADVQDLPLIPWSFKSRKPDNIGTNFGTSEDYFTPVSSTNQMSHPVVISSFNINITPGQPYVNFDFSGEFVYDIMGTMGDAFSTDATGLTDLARENSPI